MNKSDVSDPKQQGLSGEYGPLSSHTTRGYQFVMSMAKKVILKGVPRHPAFANVLLRRHLPASDLD
jgi:hypothetical protein